MQRSLRLPSPYERADTLPAPDTPIEKRTSGYMPPTKSGAPTLFGIELKWISLLTLSLQNAFLTIVMHYSRIAATPDKTYMAAAAVLLNELLKGCISTLIALKRIDANLTAQAAGEPGFFPAQQDAAPATLAVRVPVLGAAVSMFRPSRLQALSRQVFSADCYKLAIPAILYVIQNNLQYVAASNLDVATFQVTYQMKILTTAFFSVFLLRRRLSRSKWFALLLLAVGVGIVQLQTTTSSSASSSTSGGAGAAHGAGERVMYPWRGFVAVTLACTTSGLAGVYFELLLKSSAGSGPPTDLWVRNAQLSLFSLVPALVPIVFTPPDGRPWLARFVGCFANFNGWAVTTVLTQTFGGLVTALVIRYSDNIMKGFATSLSIVISFLASVALFNYPITFSFVLGASTVLFSTYLYNAPNVEPPTRSASTLHSDAPISSSEPILGQQTPERPSRTSSMMDLLGLGLGLGGSRSASPQPSAGETLHTLLSAPGPSFGAGHDAPSPHTAASGPGATAGSASAPAAA